MFERLISLVRREQVSLFIGAGFSIEACAPSVRDLRNAILNEIFDERKRASHQDDNLDVLSEYFVEEECLGSRNQLIKILQKAFDFTPECMDDHKLLAKIPHFKRIFTTNYDTLLESSFDNNDVHVVRNDADCAYLTKPFSVFKIHGDFTAPDSVVITTSDYKEFFTSNKNPIMWNMVTNEFATKNMLFIGYSLEDENILDIIKKVSTAQKNNQNEMFLIAPGISQEKQDVLKKMKVHYYDAKANAFLTQLIKELEEHITEDFQDKHISEETYSRFWHSHKAVPVVATPVKGRSVIKKVEPISDEPLEHKIKISVKAEIGEKLNNFDFEKDGEIVPNPITPDVPCFRISGDNLIKGNYIVNGIVLTGIKEIIVAPVENKMDLSFRISSRDFFEVVTAKVYQLNEYKTKLVIDCDVYKITMEFHFLQEKTVAATINFTFNKTYKNNNEAIKWIDVPCALSNNEDFIIQEFSMLPLKLSNPTNKTDDFEKFKQYYKDIKRIESASGKKFKVYNEYTEKNYRIARYVCSYLNREPLSIYCEDKNGLDISTKTEEGEEIIETFKVKDYISIVTTEEKKLVYNLNNRTFNIPFGYKIYNSCQIKSMQKDEDGNTLFEFHYGNPTYFLLLSDKTMTEEFPEMKPLRTIIKTN